MTAAATRPDDPAPPWSVDLWWIPLGAGTGGVVVRTSGRIYEAVVAALTRRPACALYHSALTLRLDGADVAVEMAPVWVGRGDRGIVAEGPVGSRRLGRLALFRYGVRRWSGGTIPDLGAAVGGPRRLSTDPATVRRIYDLVPNVPVLTWGRDQLRTGDMWNSNSSTSWLLVGAGIEVDTLLPPDGGRAPGWHAGIAAARRCRPAETPPDP